MYAHVVINEFSSGSSADWVELYNDSTESADLSSYRLGDSSTGKKNLSGTLAPLAYISFSFSNRLNNSGDTVKLVRINGEQEELVEEISYGDVGGMCAANKDQTIGRVPNDLGKIVRFVAATQEGANTAGEVACETVAPSPSPSPKTKSSSAEVKIAPSPIAAAASITASVVPTLPKKTLASLKPLTTFEATATPESFVSSPQGEVLAASDSAKAKFPMGPLLVVVGTMLTTIAGLLAFRKSDQV